MSGVRCQEKQNTKHMVAGPWLRAAGFARPSVRPRSRTRPRRRCTSFDFEDEDDDEDDLRKIEAQNSISVFCHLFSDT